MKNRTFFRVAHKSINQEFFAGRLYTPRFLMFTDPNPDYKGFFDPDPGLMGFNRRAFPDGLQADTLHFLDTALHECIHQFLWLQDPALCPNAPFNDSHSHWAFKAEIRRLEYLIGLPYRSEYSYAQRADFPYSVTRPSYYKGTTTRQGTPITRRK